MSISHTYTSKFDLDLQNTWCLIGGGGRGGRIPACMGIRESRQGIEVFLTTTDLAVNFFPPFGLSAVRVVFLSLFLQSSLFCGFRYLVPLLFLNVYLVHSSCNVFVFGIKNVTFIAKVDINYIEVTNNVLK